MNPIEDGPNGKDPSDIIEKCKSNFCLFVSGSEINPDNLILGWGKFLFLQDLKAGDKARRMNRHLYKLVRSLTEGSDINHSIVTPATFAFTSEVKFIDYTERGIGLGSILEDLEKEKLPDAIKFCEEMIRFAEDPEGFAPMND